MKHIKSINEAVPKFYFKGDTKININKLIQFAYGIALCCDGEYGDTFYNEQNKQVFVCLGDSNPFDPENLEANIKYGIVENYDSAQGIEVIVENECYPTGEGWTKFDYRSQKFVPYNTKKKSL